MIEFYLKILSGNHIGAEIPLEAGRYSLGRDENCDLVLTDASINEIELILEITQEGQIQIQTSTADEPLYLNGEPAGSSIQCNHFDVITSSGLFFALGPVDVQWPEILLPKLQYPEPETEDSEESSESDPPETDEEDSTEGYSTEDFENDSDELPALGEVNEILDEEEYEEEYEEEDDAPFTNINKKWLIAIPAALVFIFLILILASGGDPEAPPQELSYLDQARQVRQELNLQDISLQEMPDKNILITGYTLTSKKKRELQKLFRERGIPFNSQIVAMSELRSNASELLNRRGYKNLLLELDNTPGSLVLTGYISTSEELEQLVTTMKQEIHGLIAIVDQIENQTSRVNTLKSMLRERKLSTRTKLIIRPGKVIIQGHLLDEGQTYNLQELVQRFKDRYGKNPALIVASRSNTTATTVSNSSAATSGKIVLPALSIRGISMGRVPYVVMEDGSKYLVGAKLANGYIIEDINLEYLLLTNGTDRIKYRLGGNRDGQ